MPSGITDYGTEAWLAALFGVTSPITSYYIALCTEPPGVAMDGTILEDLEPPSGVGYARVHYTTGASNWDTSDNYLVNINDIDFGHPTAAWGLISHYALTDVSSGGNLYAFGEFLNPQYVTQGFHFVIPAGGLVISMASLENSIAV